MADAKRDQNQVPTLLLTDDVTGLPVPAKRDSSGRLLCLAVASGGGDVTGPASSNDNAIVRFDGLTGKIIQNSDAILDDSENLSGIGDITGKAGGITLTGGTGSGDDIRITSTSNATKGTINIGNATSGVFLDEANSRLSFGLDQHTLNVFGMSFPVMYGQFSEESNELMVGLGRASDNIGDGAQLFGARSRGTLASPTAVQANDVLMEFGAAAYDGSTNYLGGMVRIQAAENASAGSTPADILLMTTPTGSGNVEEAVRIRSTKDVRLANGVSIQTGTTAADTYTLKAYNTGGASYTTFATLTAGATPTMTLSGVTSTGAWSPTTSDGGALGSTSLMWADLFLASGGVINFNNGDVTITHSANALDIDGGVVDFGSTPTVNGAAIYFTGGTDVALADGGTGASLADPNADRIMFWDDSAGQVTWLTAGTGLTITDTTISASASSTERRHMCPNFVVANMSTSGTAPTNAVINNGVQCSVNSSGASSVASIQHGDAQSLDFYDKNPEFFIAAYYSAGISTGSGDVWAGDTGNTVPPTVTQTTKSMFLIIETTAGTPTWSAVNANGTTNTNTTLSGTPSNVTYTIRIVKNSTTNIKYYTDYTLKATHTTNLPSGDVVNDNIFSVGVKNDGGDGTTRTAIFGLGDIVIDAATG